MVQQFSVLFIVLLFLNMFNDVLDYNYSPCSIIALITHNFNGRQSTTLDLVQRNKYDENQTSFQKQLLYFSRWELPQKNS